MDIRKIKKLIELLEESGIAEIEIKEGEEALRISRMPTGSVPLPSSPTMPMALPGGSHGSARRRPRPPRPPRLPRPRRKPTSTSSPRPMVGTFYGAPSPGRQGVHRDRR